MSAGPRIVRKPKAKRDIVDIASFIALDSAPAAERFVEAVEVTLQALARMPRMGAARTFRRPSLAGLRMWSIKGFERYLVFYRPLPDGIDVIRVVHGARDIQRLFA